jgi:hypothetical protein
MTRRLGRSVVGASSHAPARPGQEPAGTTASFTMSHPSRVTVANATARCAHVTRLARTSRTRMGGDVSTTSSGTFEDLRIGVRLKISALWIAMLFLFAYGDIFGFFNPGQIEEVVAGEISGIEITQAFLLAVSVYIAIATVMIFLSLVLRPAVCRWTNIVLAILYVGSIVASAIGETDAYYLFLSVFEIALLLLIVRHAWTWPRKDGAGDPDPGLVG